MSKEEQLDKVMAEKPSAYRSIRLSKLRGDKPKKDSRLRAWTEIQQWQNLTAQITDNKKLECGTKGKKQQELNLPSVCRPQFNIKGESLLTADKFNEKQIRKAIKLKQKGQRIVWSEL